MTLLEATEAFESAVIARHDAWAVHQAKNVLANRTNDEADWSAASEAFEHHSELNRRVGEARLQIALTAVIFDGDLFAGMEG